MAIDTIPGLQQLWAETLGHPDICLAILDGPVDQTHPSLHAARLNRVETMISAKADQGPATRHGTHVTSIIFGQHGGPVKGIAPHCRGLIVPIFTDGASGSITPCSQLDLARAIIQAVAAGAHIINISGGEFSHSGTAHPILNDAIQTCTEQGVLIVAAAGNEGCQCLHIPGAVPSVLAVGAIGTQNQPLEFSNWGESYRSQGILAPGENILGATPGGGTTTQSGTSYATPIVAGVAALLLALQKQRGQTPNPHTVRAILLESARACNPQAVSDCRPFLVGSLDIPGAQAHIKAADEQAMIRPSDSGDEMKIEKVQPNTNLEQSQLKIGDVAPDFSVLDYTGREVRLRDYQGKNVVLWFYPEADTPG